MHRALLQLKTSWWKLMLSTGYFCHVPDFAFFLPLLRDARSGCLCEVSPFRATIQKAMLGQAMGCLALFPAP